MVCNKCGSQQADTSPFCTSCGNRLAAAPQQNYYQGYQQHPPVAPQAVSPAQYAQKTEPVTSIGKYLLWWLIGLIPLAGFILTIVFAADKSDMNRANFFRAQLIIMAISVGLAVLTVVIAVSVGVNMVNDFYDIFDAIEYLI